MGTPTFTTITTTTTMINTGEKNNKDLCIVNVHWQVKGSNCHFV